ncbi:MAG: hypothetical protein ACYC1M_14120 [Armatimonadota bacterium]
MYALNSDNPKLIEVSTKHDHWNLELVKPWSLVGVSNNALLLKNGSRLLVQFADAKKDYAITGPHSVQQMIVERYGCLNISDQRLLGFTRFDDKYALYDRASKNMIMIKGASVRMSETGSVWSIGKPECSGVIPVSPHLITIPAGNTLTDWSVWHAHAVVMCYQKESDRGRLTIMVKDAYDRVISRIWLKEAPLKIMACQEGVILAYWSMARYILDTYNWLLHKTGSNVYRGIGFPFTTSVVEDGVYKRLTKISHRRASAWQ